MPLTAGPASWSAGPPAPDDLQPGLYGAATAP